MTLIASARIRALSIISIMVIVLAVFLSSAVQAASEVTVTTQYRVQPGDTLWQIVREHSPSDQDPRRVIAIIEKLNGIDGGHLQAGEVIEIPVISP